MKVKPIGLFFSSLSYQTFPIAEEEEAENSAETYKSPPIRTWKKFPPVEGSSCFPDSASTPYNVSPNGIFISGGDSYKFFLLGSL